MFVDADNAELRRAVFARLVADPSVGTGRLVIKVHRGEVTLGGYVANDVQKGAALIAAGRVTGVASVTDEIQVAPPPLADMPVHEGARRPRLTLSHIVRGAEEASTIGAGDIRREA